MSRLRKKNRTAKRHQYYTHMKYDGNTLSVESQQDDQPIRRKKYTLKQLRREIPVAAELINKYLDGKVPNELHKHQHSPHTVSIYPVLPNPVDLGLIPPAPTTASRRARIRIGDEFSPISMGSDCSPSTCERSNKSRGRNTMRRKHHIRDDDDDDDDDADTATDQMMKLFVSEKGADDRRKIRFM